MRFKLWLEAIDFSLMRPVPPEPGTAPIPANHVRLYHYTKYDTSPGHHDADAHLAAEKLRTQGIDIGKARGSTYGEPNVVWASTEMPSYQKVFAEFSMAMDDPRWAQGKPEPEVSPQEYEARKWDCYFFGSIHPNEIIAVHEPWHGRYRYLRQNPELIQQVVDGEFDHLLNNSEYGPAVRRVKAEFGTGPNVAPQPTPSA